MFDMDTITGLGVLAVTGVSGKVRSRRWKAGEKLRILLVGYNGKRNTGADVRVSAMVDQYYRIFGKDRIEIGILTLNEENLRVYYNTDTHLIPFSSIFFKDLLDACSDYHMAVLCEGSCLKSKFANSLTLFFCEAAGIMRKQGKPCLAYGSEAGYMDPWLLRIVSSTCPETYFIARTEPSLEIIRGLGLEGHLGTDTAWTFPPASREWAMEELGKKAGWDGKRPIIGAAVVNPFYWPVKPSLARWFRAALTRDWEDNYEKWYFFSSSKERKEQFAAYASAIARSLDHFAGKYDTQVLLIGMEALDLDHCKTVQKMMKIPATIFSSVYYDGYQMNAILRMLSMLVTSRYHARVLSTPGGVPSIAVSMDERLYNLLKESGHLEDFYLKCDDEDLGAKLPEAMEHMWEVKDTVREELLKIVPRYLKMMGEMGMFFRDFVGDSFPGIDLPPATGNWQDYLPPLYPGLEDILEQYGRTDAKD